MNKTEFTPMNRQQRKIDNLDKIHLEQKNRQLEEINFELKEVKMQYLKTIKYLYISIMVIIGVALYFMFHLAS